MPPTDDQDPPLSTTAEVPHCLPPEEPGFLGVEGPFFPLEEERKDFLSPLEPEEGVAEAPDLPGFFFPPFEEGVEGGAEARWPLPEELAEETGPF